MRKMLAGIVIISGLFLSIVFIGGLMQNQKSSASTSSTNPSPSVDAKTAATTFYSASEVATHNSPSDCWLIINDKVYGVASFLNEHPGGVQTITPYCGKEATNAFNTKDRGSGSGHSPQASEMLADYLVGTLKT